MYNNNKQCFTHHLVSTPSLLPNHAASEADRNLISRGSHHHVQFLLGDHLIAKPQLDELDDAKKKKKKNENDSLYIIRVYLPGAKSVKVSGTVVKGDKDHVPPKNQNNLPDAKNEEEKGVFLRFKDEPVSLQKTGESFFEAIFKLEPIDDNKSNEAPPKDPRLKYKCLVTYQNDETVEIGDPYNHTSNVAREKLVLFSSGSCWNVDDMMGSHPCVIDDLEGVRFLVWAPNAANVNVIGDWNGFDGSAHQMRKYDGFDIWELFIPSVAKPGNRYYYQIRCKDFTGGEIIKIDPYAQEFEIPPSTASIISAADDPFKPEEKRFQWEDDEWMTRRITSAANEEFRRKPASIYELHLPSWRRNPDGSALNYREIAPLLVEHVKKMNFTFVEFLPVTHHPFAGSWGYQVAGSYAVYSLLGKPDDFKFLVNTLHKNEIGVILDLVLGHFCRDDFALSNFDGSPCYEYADQREGIHYGWGTKVFNYSRNEVRSYLLGSAYHWLRRYHIDGLRLDAVSSMIYKNFDRPDGAWLPNVHGGCQNLEAVSLLQELNWVMKTEFPGCLSIAEESTAWRRITTHIDGGLGFDAKWDLGWMNDALSFLSTAPHERPDHYHKLIQRATYDYTERWVLPLSHDEVVHGKGSLLSRCGFTHASFEDRLRTLKVLFGMQVGLPGRPLIFMGCEFGQGREWRADQSIAWDECKGEPRMGVFNWLSTLLYNYKTRPALHAGDDEPWNIEWIDRESPSASVVAFLRKYQNWENDVLVICNFAVHPHRNYPIGVPHGVPWEVILNSDATKYHGLNSSTPEGSLLQPQLNVRQHFSHGVYLDLNSYTCVYLVPRPGKEL